MSSAARAYERAAQVNGYVECRRCLARELLSGDDAPEAIARQVRAFTRAHEHGAVLTVTPFASTKAPSRPRCHRCGQHGHTTRGCSIPKGIRVAPECAWCGAAATTRDEDGDPSCEQHAREQSRPEVSR